MNIRELNKIIESNSYFMSLQSNIIEVVVDVKYIFVIDVVAFFYQFRVKFIDRHKLTIMSHHEQKYFLITSMKFKNSSTYAQRQINKILRDLKHCCKVFIDDIIIFFSSLKKHVEYLFLMF